MKYCRESKQVVPDEATVCPLHKTARCLSVFGDRAGAAAAGPKIPAPPAPKTGTNPKSPVAAGPTEEALRLELRGLEHRVHAGKRRGLLLAVGTVVVLLVGAAVWLAHEAYTNLSYAQLDPDIEITRYATDPSRLIISFRPLSEGRVGFQRLDAEREAEILDRVTPAPEGKKTQFQWLWRTGAQEGAVLRVTSRDGWSLKPQTLTVPPVVPAEPLGDATLHGEVVSAATGKPLAGADVQLVGTPLKTQTGTDGRFRLTAAPAERVSVEIAAPGFITDQFERDLEAKGETPIRRALSPGMEEGYLRLVLTWGPSPPDLDAHLLGPLPSGERFHIYFNEKGDLQRQQFVKLDVDCRDGRGPETITVSGVVPGTYHYYVEAVAEPTSIRLGKAGVEVAVIQGGQTIQRFRPDPNKAGNVWHVCEIRVTQEAGKKVARVKELDQYKFIDWTKIDADIIVMLFDTSAGMAGEPLEQAKRLASDFIAKGGHYILAAYGPETRLIHDFSNKDEALKAAIAKLQARGGAALAPGLELALAKFEEVKDFIVTLKSGEKRKPKVAVFVYSTGKPDDEKAALLLAERVKKSGIDLHTWSCGKADREFLRKLASDPGKAH